MKPYIPTNLAKLPFQAVVQRLVPGDPFTFILDKPLITEHPTNESLVVEIQAGDLFVRRFSDKDYPRVFKIRAVTPNMDGTIAYETIYVGFQQQAAE